MTQNRTFCTPGADLFGATAIRAESATPSSLGGISYRGRIVAALATTLKLITDFGDVQLESPDPGEQYGSKRPAISGDGERRQARETAGRAMSGDTGPRAVSAWHARGLGLESPELHAQVKNINSNIDSSAVRVSADGMLPVSLEVAQHDSAGQRLNWRFSRATA